ncbi:uncharacterized protein At1g43920, Chloroplastic-like [Alnus glutinosa]|uniref:uncharacterized protein At1g43920, Chloroplastic-like n=1 Tax=Alnus glutinosa TaxID=3517 RepID=UPI002D78FA1C|nr:uncharacterized protein At1g43920, Chloroplastic-like [Alnus glutinosa]
MSCSWKSEATSGEPICLCGVPAPLKTSFTDENFGRLFYGCVNYEVGRSCGFFQWKDSEMCEHARRALARVQHRHAMLNKEVVELKAKLEIEAIRYDMQVKIAKTNSRILAFSWVFFVVFLAVFWGNFYGVSQGYMSYKRLP